MTRWRRSVVLLVLCAAGTTVVALPGRQSAPPARVRVALTFDDLPDHGPLPPTLTRVDVARSILEALRSHHAPPTYGFINAKQLQTRPDDIEVLRLWRAGGHPLGNHTFSHMDLHAKTVDAFEQEIVANEDTLRSLMAGQDWHWFRYPYLKEGDTPEKYRAVRALLTKHGYRVAQVTLSFNDYAYNEPYTRCLARNDRDGLASLEQNYLDRAADSLVRGQQDAQAVFGRTIAHVMLLHIGAFETVMFPRLLELLDKKGFALASLQDVQADAAYTAVPDRPRDWSGTLLEQMRPARPPSPQGTGDPLQKIGAICRGE